MTFPCIKCKIHKYTITQIRKYTNTKCLKDRTSQPYRTEFLLLLLSVTFFTHPNSEHFMCIFNRWALQGPLDFNRYSLQRKSKFGAFFLNFTIQWRWCFCNQNSTKWPEMALFPSLLKSYLLQNWGELVICVGHTAWVPEGRERRSQAGPKGQKSGRRPPARNRGPAGP